MLNKRVGSLALLLITTAAAGLYGCGSDDDTVAAGGSGGGGASGSAGKGGSTGKAGSGTAGAAEAGAPAAGASGAMGDEGGTGGAMPATGGAAGGDEVGAGGEAGGGSVALTLAEACTIVCADQTGLSCSFGTKCMDDCTGNEMMSPAPPEEYDAMFECEAQHLTASKYECSDQGGGLIWPAPKDGTTCEPAICKWTCDDGGLIADVNIYTRCGCG